MQPIHDHCKATNRFALESFFSLKSSYVSNKRACVVSKFPNFWSFNFIAAMACHFNLVAKPSLVMKLQILKVEVAFLYSFYVVKKRIFGEVQLSRCAISKPVKVFLPNESGKPLTSMKLNDKIWRALLTSFYHFQRVPLCNRKLKKVRHLIRLKKKIAAKIGYSSLFSLVTLRGY